MPRFVILWHETPAGAARPAHYDLMFEAVGVLWTWAVERLPRPGESVATTRLADHRLDYLDYEGPIAGNRGAVRRVDAGMYKELPGELGSLVVALAGTVTRARWQFTPVLPAGDATDRAAGLLTCLAEDSGAAAAPRASPS